MALPKGVKSGVDYRGLYSSNELEGNVLLEKEPELPKFNKTDNPSFKKNKVDPTLNKKGGDGFMDYSKSKNTFKDFTKRGGIAGFVNRRLGIGATKFKKPILSAKALGKAALTVAKANPKTTAAVAVGAAVLPPIINKAKQIIKQRSDAKIDKDVEKYVSDRQLKGGPKKVNYKGTNVVPPFRNKEGEIVKRSGESYKQYTPSRFTGSPFKASPLNKNKNIYGTTSATKTPLQMKYPLDKILEATMTPAQKRKDTMLKKKYEKSDDMLDSFKDQYGEKKGKEVFYAFIRKKSMEEENIQEILDKKDVPHVKKLVKKLRDGSKTHAKQADNLEKAMNEDITDEALTIQNWNVDEINYTEVETVDIIKPQPLKPSPSNWREDLGEDWQKVNRKDKTDGLSRKAVKAYRRENPGSKLQTAVTKDPKKLKKGSKSAKRRLSFCRRMKGMKKKLTSAKTRRDPDSRINKALRRWNC